MRMAHPRKGSRDATPSAHQRRNPARAAVCAAVLAAALWVPIGIRAQTYGTVAGQITIRERPGETTDDLGNAVVFLEPIASASAPIRPESRTTVIALRRRQFEPRVRVVSVGTTVSFLNQDPFSHNVFSKLHGGFDTGVYGRNTHRDNVFTEAGVYPLYCNIHPRMTAFVIALATPYYTQAGDDGRFTIERVPAGRYRLHVWHDRVPLPMDSLVVVQSAALANIRVLLDATSYRYVQHKNKFGRDYTSASGDRY